MKILPVVSNPQKNIANKNKNEPSFKSDLIVSEGARLLTKDKLDLLYSEGGLEVRRQFFEGFRSLDETILALQNAFYQQTQKAKGLVIIARELDPEYEENLRVLFQFPDKRIRKIGFMSPYEILPNKFRDGDMPFGNTIRKLVGNINSALILGSRSNESIAFAKIYEELGKSGSEQISAMI